MRACEAWSDKVLLPRRGRDGGARPAGESPAQIGIPTRRQRSFAPVHGGISPRVTTWTNCPRAKDAGQKNGT